MKLWGGIVLSALAYLLASASLASAAAVSAKPSFEVRERRLSTFLEVDSSNGYQALIGTQGHQQVTLILFKGKAFVIAQTTGRVTRKGIEARFGALGRISVRFHARSADEATGILGLAEQHGGSGSRCHGRKPIYEHGFFSGRIQFRGENGFTRIGSRRAPGLVRRRYRQVCRRAPRNSSNAAALEGFLGKLRYTTLQAQGRSGGVKVFFEATAIDFSALLGKGAGVASEFTAVTVEHREGMLLTRKISGMGREETFLFSKKGVTPRTATVTAEKPFKGSAEYLAANGAPAAWTGTLAAHLPGAGLVAMAGPGFHADLCRLTFAAKLDGERCLKGSEPPLRPLSDFSVGATASSFHLLD
jgi:hypothetical protein